ncbi:MAG TPA: hypothetical protein VIC08_11000 [Cellvibrionaceae bacterium]
MALLVPAVALLRRLPSVLKEGEMKYLFLLFLLIQPFHAMACSDESQDKLPTFAKLIKEGDDADVLIFYPKKFESADAGSVSIIYFNNKEFRLLVNTNVQDIRPDEHEVDPDQYKISNLTLNMAVIDDIEILIEYWYPPSPDGSVLMCSPRRHFKLRDIIKA